MTCVIRGCGNGSHLQNRSGDNAASALSALSYHRFPSDKKLQAVWIEKSGRTVAIPNIKNARVCSEHFLASDFDSRFALFKSVVGSSAHRKLNKGAVPSVKLPGTSCGSQKQRGGARPSTATGPAAEDDADDDELAQQRRKNRQLRQERQERRERKELVEKLLAEHDRKQQEERLQPAPQPPAVEVIELVKHGARTRRAKAGSGEAASDDDAPFFEDDGAAAGGVSDGEETAPSSSAPAPASAANTAAAAPSTLSPALRAALTSSRPSIASPRPGLATARARPYLVSHRKMPKRSTVMVERTKDMLRLKLQVRRLEAKCLRVLSAPRGSAAVAGEQEGAEPAEEAETPPAEPAPPTAGALVVLREERPAKLPSIVAQLRQNQMSEDVTTFTPSNLKEAQEVNHQLKMQFLTLQAAMLKWAIKNKRHRDAKLKEAAERRQKSAVKTVGLARLRELLRLEASVKAMFTEAQMRALTREESDTEKRKFAPHWGEEDLKRALQLRAISSDKVLDHVRDKMKIPLPSMHTIKLRCKKSPELRQAYVEAMQRSEERQRRCDICERQVDTVNEVIGEVIGAVIGAEDAKDSEEETPFGRQFVQRKERDEPRKRKRHGRPPTGQTSGKKARPPPPPPPPALDWEETSDSDAELSDPGLWGRVQQRQLGRRLAEPPLWDHLPPLGPDPERRRAWR